MKYKIAITINPDPKPKPNPSALGFGNIFTDHMFLMDYVKNEGWHNARIVPFAPIEFHPAANIFHYSQSAFEGLKAFKTNDGGVRLFRPNMNAKRANISNERLCIPVIDEEFYVDAIKALVEIDRDWVPDSVGTSLYIRPFILGTENSLGVHPSNQYLFVIILSPVGSYYEGGLEPTKILVEDEYVRAVPGGTGFTKVGANYASSLKSQKKALEMGFSQVLWLDGNEHKYVEEIGTSNAFFVISGEVFTAPLTGTILPGITRDSVIQLLRDWQIPTWEKRFTIDEVCSAYEDNTLSEVFASGTAAVISPIGELRWGNKNIVINGNEIGPLSQRLYDTLTGIQNGVLSDPHGWIIDL